ncbi:MAG: methyltransferase domain-containing protein [Bacteroidetes bacterium]|nr:methyltransferase domain-containing protein [Bacteroidota bacterium]
MKRILSYIYPFRLKNYKSAINGSLELNLVNGKLILDTDNSNYSYGSLQRILRFGLKKINLDNKINSILLLGLGGGSVIQTIREEFNSNALIEAVDIDSEIIEIALKDFNINRFENVTIVQSDANEYLINCQNSFDLIIVDLFIVDTIPIVFTTPAFIDSLKAHLTVGGKIIYNTMQQTMPTEMLNKIICRFNEGDNFNVKILEKVEGTNDLIIVEKYC